MVDPREDHYVEEQKEATHGDGDRQSRRVALVVAGSQLPQEVVVVFVAYRGAGRPIRGALCGGCLEGGV